MDSVAVVGAALTEMRQRFDAENDVSRLQDRMRTNAEMMAACTKRRDLRLRNSWPETERAQRDMLRSRKRTLFDTLATDVQEAAVESRQKHAGQVPATERKKQEKEVHEEAASLLKDVILIDNGDGLQDARTHCIDDVCCNCGSLMERNLQLSYPNLDCGHMKWYLDNSTYSSNTYSAERCAKNSPKCVTHFSTFLNVAQGKTTKYQPRVSDEDCVLLLRRRRAAQGGHHERDREPCAEVSRGHRVQHLDHPEDVPRRLPPAAA